MPSFDFPIRTKLAIWAVLGVLLVAGMLAEQQVGDRWAVHQRAIATNKQEAAVEALHFVHQDLGLIPMLSTVENLDLGRRAGRSLLALNRTGPERRRARELISGFGTMFDVEVPVGQLSAAEQRIVAMARAMANWSRPESVLLLDEPTASLPAGEVRRLFDAVRHAAEGGAGIVFISHRLDEVLEIADRIVVLRDGKVVADAGAADVDHEALVRLIAGRALDQVEYTPAALASDVVLSISDVSGGTVRGASLSVRRGEIVGLAGILGSGREDLAGLVFGALGRTGGEVRVAGVPLTAGNPGAAIRAGLGFVPADRHAQGAVMDAPARENLTLPRLAPLRRAVGRLDLRAERAEAAAWAKRVDLRPPLPERPLRQFSGGNQQKVVLARWLRTEPAALLLDEPTQGVDVAAKAAIYALLAQAAAAGMAVLVSSSDSKELASLCHRAAIMRDGRVAAVLDRPSLTEANLVRESLGLRRDEVEPVFGEPSGGSHE